MFVRSKTFFTSFVVDIVKLLMFVLAVVDVVEFEVDVGAEVDDVDDDDVEVEVEVDVVEEVVDDDVVEEVVVVVQFSMLVDPVDFVFIPNGHSVQVDEFVASVALE